MPIPVRDKKQGMCRGWKREDTYDHGLLKKRCAELTAPVS